MFKNMSIKSKLMLFPTILVIMLVVAFMINSYKMSSMTTTIKVGQDGGEAVTTLLHGRIAVYQYLDSPSDESAKKVVERFTELKKDSQELLERVSLPENKDRLKTVISSDERYLADFQKLEELRGKGSANVKEDGKEIIKDMVDIGRGIEKNITEMSSTAKKLAEEKQEATKAWTAGIFVSIAVIFVIFSIIVANVVIASVSSIQSGMASFFRFLNRETAKADAIKLDGTDEFAQMAKMVNNNIKQIEEGLVRDNQTVTDALSVVEQIKEGCLTSTIKSNPNNPQLIQLKDALNQSVEALNTNISKALMPNTTSRQGRTRRL
jgi:methyl-accepting chemotaxis protein